MEIMNNDSTDFLIDVSFFKIIKDEKKLFSSNKIINKEDLQIKEEIEFLFNNLNETNTQMI